MKFEIFQSEANSKYYFRLKAKNGQVVLSGNAHDTVDAAKATIAVVQERAGDAANFKTNETATGKFTFSLRSSENKPLGNSQSYKSEKSMKNGIASVGRSSDGATTVEV